MKSQAGKSIEKMYEDKIFYKGKATGNEELDSDYSFKGDTLLVSSGKEKFEYVRVK